VTTFAAIDYRWRRSFLTGEASVNMADYAIFSRFFKSTVVCSSSFPKTNNKSFGKTAGLFNITNRSFWPLWLATPFCAFYGVFTLSHYVDGV